MTRRSFPSLRSKTLDFHRAVERTKLSGAFPRMDKVRRAIWRSYKSAASRQGSLVTRPRHVAC
jgi:hypothetical protein